MQLQGAVVSDDNDKCIEVSILLRCEAVLELSKVIAHVDDDKLLGSAEASMAVHGPDLVHRTKDTLDFLLLVPLHIFLMVLQC